jgi:TetR/AcrR family transcriptional regulator
MTQGAVKTPGKRSQAVSAKKQAILSAALETFSQFGIHGTRLEQVAEQSGVSKTNLLYYYPSKEALYVAVMQQILDIWLAPLKAFREAGPAGGDQRVHSPEAGGVARLPAGITAVLS